MKPAVYVTPERVFAAANRLKNQGVPLIEITNARIRRELGGGSMEDIQPLLKEWKMRTLSPVELDIPDEIKQEIQLIGQSVWQTAARLAQEKAARQYADYHVTVRERDELYKEVDSMDVEVDRLKDAMLHIYGELMKLKDDVIRKGTELGVYRARQDTEGFMNVAEAHVLALSATITELLERHFQIAVGAPTLEEPPESAVDTQEPPPASPDSAG